MNLNRRLPGLGLPGHAAHAHPSPAPHPVTPAPPEPSPQPPAAPKPGMGPAGGRPARRAGSRGLRSERVLAAHRSAR